MLEHDPEYRRQVALRLRAFVASRPLIPSEYSLSPSVIPGASSSAAHGHWQELQHDIHASDNQVALHGTKRLVKSAFFLVLCFGTAVCSEAQDTQPNSPSDSWTSTTQTSVDHASPVRTLESHVTSGNRTVDKRRQEVLGPDGQFQPDSDTEKETVQVDDTTMRTTVRTYTWDLNGKRKLAKVTEEEARTSASGDVHVVSTTSSSDLNGNLQVVQREVADTKKTSPDAQETKTTVYLADGNGGFTTSRQTLELQKRSADQKIELKKTTLLPDGNGNWQVGEVTKKSIKEDGKKRITEEQVSRPDSEGRLSEFSRTVGEETETGNGQKSNTVDTYSTVVPGVTGDGRLHLSQRVTTVEKKDSAGKVTEQQVEQPNPGDPHAGLQVSSKTKYTVLYSASGTQQTKTVQARDSNGTFNVISVETRKSDQAHDAQQQTPPSDKPQ